MNDAINELTMLQATIQRNYEMFNLLEVTAPVAAKLGTLAWIDSVIDEESASQST